MDDVAIVGGGPAGSFAALLLARAGLRVRLFDRARFPRHKLCGDTLNPGACATLARHLALESLLAQSLPLDGMLLTGPGGVRVRGVYPSGTHGFAVERRVFDHWLLQQAMSAGAMLEDGTVVVEAIRDAARVAGVRVRARGQSRRHTARLVIAADGRHSRIGFALRLTRHAARPRRWAIGGYFDGVEELTTAGEMHVRRGHYLGVAPMPGGLANACLVVPYDGYRSGFGDPAALLLSHIKDDPQLRERFVRARAADAPSVLGPMAVEARDAGVPGLLLAGDAAGFVDPMTGDGLTFALRGAELAATVAMEVLGGRLTTEAAPHALRQRRQAAFNRKLRFNRALRALVASPVGVSGAALAARMAPALFESMIHYAGDVA